MEIQKQDEQNLGISFSIFINRKKQMKRFSLIRIWLSGVGIADILDGSINGTVHQYIQNDLQDFGRLILMLACNSIVGAQKEHLQTSLDIVQRSYSHDLKNLIL